VTSTVEGINEENVTAWFGDHATGVTAPLRFELITGGHSNLTFRVTDADERRWVLRRPPLHQVLATAHDMSREHKIIAALGPTDVPVPPIVGLCTDEAVNESPFYVMEFVDGTVVRDVAIAEKLSLEVRRTAGDSIVSTLAKIHAVDVDAVGLGDLGKKEDYIARQLRRWYGQFQSSQTREIPVIDEVHATLLENIPAQGPASIVHGDYRLDNCMIGSTGDIVAVLDWELCTLGDPLADLGLLVVYSPDSDADTPTGVPAPTSLDGFPSTKEMLDQYVRTSGRDLSQIDYYVAFGYWKLACIVEGVYARYVGGAMGDRGDTASFEVFGKQVIALGDRARDAVERIR